MPVSAEVSCRRGGGAERDCCCIQSAPTQSPPRNIVITQRVISRQWEQFLKCKCVSSGLWRIVSRDVTPQANALTMACDSASPPFTRSPAPALGAGTRGRREWRSARKACCAARGDTTTKVIHANLTKPKTGRFCGLDCCMKGTRHVTVPQDTPPMFSRRNLENGGKTDFALN